MIFEENARAEKLAIDMKVFVQILEEENHSHEEVVRELDEKLQEENRLFDKAVKQLDEELREENFTHGDVVKELEEKIAGLQRQIGFPSRVENISTEAPFEPAQEMTEPLQETPTEVDEHANEDEYQDARALLQESKPIESEVSTETPKKKKRGFF